MRKRIDFKSEDGAALVLEAVIVYPIALVAVMFLIMWGLTYLQQGYLQYQASSLSNYIARCTVYPGYEKIDAPFYEARQTTILQSINSAMEVHNPYRYFGGLDEDITKIVEESKTKMVDEFIPSKGFLKAAEDHDIPVPDDLKGMEVQSTGKRGYTCAIVAGTGFSRVYIAQNYIFADFFRMIGLGGKKMVIYGDSMQYIGDSVEVVRVTDFAFDAIEWVIGLFGSDADATLKKIRSVIDMFKRQ